MEDTDTPLSIFRAFQDVLGASCSELSAYLDEPLEKVQDYASAKLIPPIELIGIYILDLLSLGAMQECNLPCSFRS